MNEEANRLRVQKTYSREMAGCEGKPQYASYSDANKVVRHAMKHNSKPLHVYRCQFCEKYHTGRPRKKGK